MTATLFSILPGGGTPVGLWLHRLDGGVAEWGCAAWCWGWVDALLRDKRFDMRWCTVGCLGQHIVVPVGPLSHG